MWKNAVDACRGRRILSTEIFQQKLGVLRRGPLGVWTRVSGTAASMTGLRCVHEKSSVLVEGLAEVCAECLLLCHHSQALRGTLVGGGNGTEPMQAQAPLRGWRKGCSPQVPRLQRVARATCLQSAQI